MVRLCSCLCHSTGLGCKLEVTPLWRRNFSMLIQNKPMANMAKIILKLPKASFNTIKKQEFEIYKLVARNYISIVINDPFK